MTKLIAPETLESLRSENVDAAMAETLTKLYRTTKDPYVRNRCLCLLHERPFALLDDFFAHAWTKERHPDMRLLALRGLAHFRNEAAIATLLAKFDASLVKMATTTPYNYQVYECLLGKNALPFLVRHYAYDCFSGTLSLVQRLYDAMPSAFKGHFTIDDSGRGVALRTPEESKTMIEEFFATRV